MTDPCLLLPDHRPSTIEMERHRIDHWLKLCCIYKHRTEATEACAGGRVHVNGKRIKPAGEVHVNDVIEIGGTHPRKLVVLEIPSGNISKEVARTMYRDETPPPPSPKDGIEAALLKAPRRDQGAGRPTKRDRRTIDRWRDDSF